MGFTVYFDVETGGVQPSHPTIQLAAIAVNDAWEECGTFERKIAFDVTTADPEALAINHYGADAWKDSLRPGAVAAQFASWIRPFCSINMISKAGSPYSVAKLSGYNALTFDLPRLRAMFNGQFFPCSYHVRDVLQRVLFYFDERGGMPANVKLATVCAHFGIATDDAHDALADVRMTAALARKLKES